MKTLEELKDIIDEMNDWECVNQQNHKNNNQKWFSEDEVREAIEKCTWYLAGSFPHIAKEGLLKELGLKGGR